MKLIVGLGNPGKEYEKTRHNVGFIAIEILAGMFGFEPFKKDNDSNAMISSGIINNEKYILLKPQTFMNRSGFSVKFIMDYYKIQLDDLIVIQDELDINAGQFKLSRNRSSAGHKGIQSIIDSLGTKDFARYRIGIESNRHNMPSEDFVLANISSDDMAPIQSAIDNICNDIKKRA